MEFRDTIAGRLNTVRTLTSLFDHHIDRKVDPKSATEEDIVNLAYMWLNNGLSPSTILSLLGLVGRYIKWAGRTPPNLKLLKKRIARHKQEEEVKALTKQEAGRLLVACRKYDPGFYPLLLCALHTGMRRGEIFGLRACDVDLKNAIITVRRSYDGPTKTGKTRKIRVTDTLSNELRYVSNLSPSDSVFKFYDPNPRLKRLCKAAGIREISIHKLRHTFATLALEAKASPREVANTLGHSSTATTIGIYWSVLDDGMDMSFLEG